MSQPGTADRRWICWLLLAAITVGLLLVGRSYHRADKRPPTFDDAWFLENSLHFYQRLTDGGLIEFLSAYASSFGTKAPLVSALALPFYITLGTRLQSAILVNFVFLILTNVYLFLLGRRLLSPWAGLAAVVFYQTMPLAYGVSRVFLADYGLAALVVIWIYYLVASEGFTRGRANFALGIVAGLGLLMKVLFPLYVAGPLALVWLERVRGQAPSAEQAGSAFWRACGRWPAAAIAIPALALAATWYSFHLSSVLGYAWQAGYGEIGERYSGPGFRVWLLSIVNQGTSFAYAAAALALLLAGLVTGGWRAVKNRRAALLASWLILPAAALAAGRNREIRLLLPLLPGLALAMAAGVVWLGRRPLLRLILVALIAAWPLRLYATLSAPVHGHAHLRTLGPFLVFARDLGWARPPDNAGRWDQHRVLEALQRIGPPSLRPRYVVVGVEHSFFNANLFRYLNAYTNYPLVFTSLGHAETSADRAVERIYSLDARYLVMAEGFHGHDLIETFNRVNGEIQARLDRAELPYRLRAKVDLGHHLQAVIYERETPWARLPPGAEPPRRRTVDFSGGVRFLGYEWKRRDRYLCELATYWTVPHQIFEDYRVNLEIRRAGRLLLAQDHFLTSAEHPPLAWRPGEVIRQGLTVFAPAGAPGGPLEARLWLTAWGIGDPHQIARPREMIHESAIPLRLEE